MAAFFTILIIGGFCWMIRLSKTLARVDFSNPDYKPRWDPDKVHTNAYTYSEPDYPPTDGKKCNYLLEYEIARSKYAEIIASAKANGCISNDSIKRYLHQNYCTKGEKTGVTEYCHWYGGYYAARHGFKPAGTTKIHGLGDIGVEPDYTPDDPRYERLVAMYTEFGKLPSGYPIDIDQVKSYYEKYNLKMTPHFTLPKYNWSHHGTLY